MAISAVCHWANEDVETARKGVSLGYIVVEGLGGERPVEAEFHAA